jgi:hypothetical protein
MPGKEIKGRSKRAMYSNGKLVGKQKKLDVALPKGVLNTADFKKLGEAGSRKKVMGGGMMKNMYKVGGRVKKAAGGGLYANIHAKKKRIEGGSGEKMRKVGSKGAPTKANFVAAAKTAKPIKKA